MIYVSVILPCRNEEKGIGLCIRKVQKAFKNCKISGEIIVSSNSDDGSADIAKKLGVKVVEHRRIGYGSAYLEGFKIAKGKYIIMGDADNTYDFLEIPKFIHALDEGYDFVIGTRLKSKILPGSMRWLHQYIGNPLLTFIFNILFRTRLSDAHSGFRAFKREVLKKMNLKSHGMEFALEMLIQASKDGIEIKEIPITYHPRKGISKLNSFGDGFRHLKFMYNYWKNKK